MCKYSKFPFHAVSQILAQLSWSPLQYRPMCGMVLLHLHARL